MSPPRNIYISNSSDHNQDDISLFDDRDDEFQQQQQQQSESMHNSLSSLDYSFHTSSMGNNGQNCKVGKRQSFRRSFTHVISSPVKMAKDRISLPSPLRISRSMGTSIHKAGGRILHPHKKDHQQQHPTTFSSLRDELDIPPEATRDEALAYMLLKELESIDL